ncbi:hypothetical protein AUJ17_04380 [Candidatus Micrarchaeota archaeon CG1_02_47_40]|nr:MAG: hypothetical protein AUJ17_04380 [Candidatus Micrarchaeota archaeon CG1_02_47_40]
MEAMEAIITRRSVRSYEARKIDKKLVDLLANAMNAAPSAGNLESRHFYFVLDEGMKKKIASCCSERQRERIASAPLIVVACADEKENRYGERGKNLYSIIDVSASVENLLIAAHSLGLGGVWVGAFEEEKVREALSVPSYLHPITLVPLGYPAEKPMPHEKKEMKKIFTFIE